MLEERDERRRDGHDLLGTDVHVLDLVRAGLREGVPVAARHALGREVALGVERRVYTAGTNKGTLDPFQPEKKSDVAHLKALQLEVHQTFIDMVKERRGAKLANNPDLFTGLFWTGVKSKELGLVDHLGDMRSFLKGRFGEKAKLRLITQPRSMFGLRQGGTPGVSAAERAAIAATDNVICAIEERALWSRFGL